jgi:D-beta-D-heptose 7-phosphate kinase/D-beta-D-heptose 1-phosphate adenosyltransferase
MSTIPLQIHRPSGEPLDRILNRVRGEQLRFLVVGDVAVDCYLHGTSERLSREAPVPLIDVSREVKYPGAAANVMCNLRSLGGGVIAGSIIGSDRAGESLSRVLRDRQICVSTLIHEPGRQTRLKERLLVRGQHMARFDRGSTSSVNLDSENRLFAAIQSIDALDMVLLCDHHEGVLSPRVLEWIIAWGHRRGIPVLVDPAGDDASIYRGATLIKANRDETRRLTGFDVEDDATARSAADRLRQLTGARYVVITLDENGLFGCGDRLVRLPTRAREVREVSGAGDTLFSTLAFAMAGGLSFEEGLNLSATAAAIAVSQPGLSTITLQDLRNAVEDRIAVDPLVPQVTESPRSEPELRVNLDEPEPATPRAILELPVSGTVLAIEELESVVEQLRHTGRRIVFTNGCFDLLHRGHVDCLAASRKLGDVLIVGVNSDASVRQLKGPDRPVNSQEHRVHVLQRLRSVDYVVVFDDDTPVDLIRRIRPDVLTKGGDYLGQKIPGAEYAGELHLIPFVDGCSTTLAIDRIRQAA